jgi:hypothetical protein
MAPQIPSKEEILKEIYEHLVDAQGLGELNNVISEIEDLDPQFFAGEDGENARESLDALREQKGVMPEHEIRSDVRYILELLGNKPDEVLVPAYPPRHGGRRRKTRSTRPKSRRGRKSRRKSLRQRK